MEETIDMDAFLKTMAVMLYSGAFDQLTGVGPHNYYLYHDPQSDRWNYPVSYTHLTLPTILLV